MRTAAVLLASAWAFDLEVHHAIAKVIEFTFDSTQQSAHEAYLLGLTPRDSAGYFHEVLLPKNAELKKDMWGLSTSCVNEKPTGLDTASAKPGDGNLPARIKALWASIHDDPLSFDDRHTAARTLMSLMAELHQPFRLFTEEAQASLKKTIDGKDGFKFFEKDGFTAGLKDLYAGADAAYWQGQLYPLQFNALFGRVLSDNTAFNEFIDLVAEEQYQHMCTGLLAQTTITSEHAMDLLDSNIKLATLRTAYVFEALQTPGGKKDKKHKNLFAHPGKHAHHSATHKPKHRPDENWQSSLMKNLVIVAIYCPALIFALTKAPILLDMLPKWAKKAI